MSRLFLLAVVIVGAIYGIAMLGEITRAAVPPRPEQPHPDIFEAPGWPSPTLQSLSPVSQKAKSQHIVTYRLITLSGCSTGTVPSDMLALEAELRNKTGFQLIRDDLSADFTYRVNCGSGQIAICGSVNVYCLGRGFPQVSDVDVSDVISTYYPESRLAVLLHETMHAIQVANEQYCTGVETSGPCNGLARFTPAPGWGPDFMGTGSLSRYGFTEITLERWDRVMYPILQDCTPFYDGDLRWEPCAGRWFNGAGWSFDPMAGVWFAPNGVAEWGECNLLHQDCWNIRANEWVFKGSTLYVPAGGYFSRPPLP